MTATNRLERWDITDPRFEPDAEYPLMATYPWSGHRRFAYDLVRFVRPRRLVELGVHVGTSFFAFCQAAKDSGLSTRLIGVDSWKGDEHAGHYGDEVFETVRRTISRYYTGLDIRLLRMLFTQAREHVDDASVDILHIDGLHTYEAVSEDYQMWLPKLAPDGIVLFHDVVESTGYGSSRFWNEIRGSFPSFTFPHAWGLGVLFPRGTRYYEAMGASDFEHILRTYTLKAELDLARIQLADVARTAEERCQAITRQDAMIAERDALIRRQDELIRDRDAAITSQASLIAERDALIRRQDELIRDRDGAIESQTRLIDERDALISRQAQQLSATEEQLGQLQAQLRRPGFCLRSLGRSLCSRGKSST